MRWGWNGWLAVEMEVGLGGCWQIKWVGLGVGRRDGVGGWQMR